MAGHRHDGQPCGRGGFCAHGGEAQGIKISAPEEIAYKNGWITKDKLMESARRYGKSPYGEHLKRVAEGRLQY